MNHGKESGLFCIQPMPKNLNGSKFSCFSCDLN